MAQPIVVDLRNIYRPDEMASLASSMRASAGECPLIENFYHQTALSLGTCANLFKTKPRYKSGGPRKRTPSTCGSSLSRIESRRQ